MSFASDITAGFDNAILDLEDKIERVKFVEPHLQLRFDMDESIATTGTAWLDGMVWQVVDVANSRTMARFSQRERACQYMRRMHGEKRATLDFRSMEAK